MSNSEVIKYTKSYRLKWNVELFNDKECGGCPFMSRDYTVKCVVLNKPLPSVREGNFIFKGRLPDCPLEKVEEN